MVFELSEIFFQNRANREFPSSTRNFISPGVKKFQEVIKSALLGLETEFFFLKLSKLIGD